MMKKRHIGSIDSFEENWSPEMIEMNYFNDKYSYNNKSNNKKRLFSESFWEHLSWIGSFEVPVWSNKSNIRKKLWRKYP